MNNNIEFEETGINPFEKPFATPFVYMKYGDCIKI